MKHYLSMAVVALALAACSDDYDDTALWNTVNDHENRIAALEQWQDEVNNNIAALQQLLNTNDMITSVTPVMENGKEVGYTIAFLHSDPVTIYHGEKGEKASKASRATRGLHAHRHFPRTAHTTSSPLPTATTTPTTTRPSRWLPTSPSNAETDYKAIVAEVTPLDDDAVLTRAASEWSATVQEAADGNITVTVTAPSNGKALLDVSLIRADGGCCKLPDMK